MCLLHRNLEQWDKHKHHMKHVLDAAATKATPVHSNLVLKGTLVVGVPSNLFILQGPRMARDLIKRASKLRRCGEHCMKKAK